MPVTRTDIERAAARIAGHVHVTPVMETDRFGPRIQFKFEHTQVTGSFKARGAFNSLLSAQVSPTGIVAASGGNHGAAVAHAATSLGHDAHVYVPELAGPAKIDVIRQTGAMLHVVPGDYADAAAAAADHQARFGALDIHPYDARDTLAGQGTCFREWEAQGLDADTVLIAIGGGGLIGGAMAWLKGKKIVGVETETTSTMSNALAHGAGFETKVSGFCANALGARRIGRLAYELAKKTNLETVLVTDGDVAEAQKRLWRLLRQHVEPAGACALAALTSGVYTPAPGEKVAVLLCGANPAPAPF